MSIYDWHEQDFADLVEALKAGKWGNKGKRWTDEEINEANFTSKFKERFDTYLRKKIHPEEVIIHKLQVWKDTFKGQRCAYTGKLLFTQDTHSAIENCKEKQSTLWTLFQLSSCTEMWPKARDLHQSIS